MDNYQFVSAPSDVESAARAYLANIPNHYILFKSRFDKPLEDEFALVDHIFTDADGTVVTEGETAFDNEMIDYFRRLGAAGVGITVVTGKPLAEVEKLEKTVPPDVPISFLCEKGAYSVHFENGLSTKKFVLSSEKLEAEVAELRNSFEREVSAIIDSLRDTSGEQRVWFGWSGSGHHKSILSIDIYGQQPPSDYLEHTGEKRDSLKLKDPELLRVVEKKLEDFVQSRHPEWRIVHLGNGNTDIAPGPIEKDDAIALTSEFRSARRVLLLGDTENDRAMFSLREKYPEKAISGLVLHRENGLHLLDTVDFITFGMANTDPVFKAVVAQRA